MEGQDQVWVWAEQRNGKLMSVSMELLGEGSKLSTKLKSALGAILIGSRIESLAKELIAYGADRVYTIDDPRLAMYQSDSYAKIIAELIEEHKPEVFLIGATWIGMDLAPRIACKVKTGLTAHCMGIDIEEIDDILQLAQVAPGFGEETMVKVLFTEKRPQMAMVRPGVMEKPARDEDRKGEIISVKACIEDKDFRARTVEMVMEEPTHIPPEEADVIVSGGWGLEAVGGFEPVEELAKVLRGAVAGTRAALDQGWINEDRMIGLSGKTVAPKLFLSLGASGAMQYTAGFLKSRVIMSINSDPKAPIFSISDIGIIGDLREILPHLLQEFKDTLSSSLGHESSG